MLLAAFLFSSGALAADKFAAAREACRAERQDDIDAALVKVFMDIVPGYPAHWSGIVPVTTEQAYAIHRALTKGGY